MVSSHPVSLRTTLVSGSLVRGGPVARGPRLGVRQCGCAAAWRTCHRADGLVGEASCSAARAAYSIFQTPSCFTNLSVNGTVSLLNSSVPRTVAVAFSIRVLEMLLLVNVPCWCSNAVHPSRCCVAVVAVVVARYDVPVVQS